MSALALKMGCALALALPAYAVTHESFQAFEERAELQGRHASHAFSLPAAEPLFLEFEIIVRDQSDEPAGIAVRVNDTEVAKVPAGRRYAVERARVLVPVPALRAGGNALVFDVIGGKSATFDISLRLHNYFGINPRFPRVYIVSDQAVAHRADQTSAAARAARFAAFYLSSLAAMAGLGAGARARRPAAAFALLLSPSSVLWAAAAYSASTPLHVWLSVEALAVLALAPPLVLLAAFAMSLHAAIMLKLATSAALTLLLSEVGLRVFNHLSPTPIFYTESQDRYRARPGAPHFDTRLNSRGYNDVEHERVRPPTVAYRIAAIGDSVVFGVVPYSANYLTLLESALAGPEPVEVIKLGVPGATPRGYVGILATEALAFAPDLVMVNFFVGNDFEEVARKPYEYSFLATYLHFLWRSWGSYAPAALDFGAGGVPYDDTAPSLSRERFLEIEVDRATAFLNDGSRLQAMADRALGHLREMRDLTRRAGTELLVVLIPAEVQIDRDLQAEVVRAAGGPASRFDFALPNRVMAAGLGDAGIRVLDLLPVFAAEAGDTRLYKPQDTHWNLAGHRLAAAAIARALRAHGR